MKKLNILNIRIDGGTQARLQLNQDVVKDYAEAMREGAVFPPIIVYHDGSDYWLADGFHRYFATKANATASIDADVRTGTLRDAILFSFSANDPTKRGLSPTAEDLRNIIRNMLLDEEWSKWTNSEIARHVGVSKMTVGRIKASMTEQPKEVSDTKKYTDKNGNEKTVNTKNLGKQTPTTKPDVSTYDERDDIIKELTDTVNSLSDENSKLKDAIALGQWDASDIEKIDAEDTIKDLREQVKIFEIDNRALRESRDMFQNRNAELMKTVSSLQRKLKQFKEEV
jgi:ParB-like chromosome segregation protein Spo0J